MKMVWSFEQVLVQLPAGEVHLIIHEEYTARRIIPHQRLMQQTVASGIDVIHTGSAHHK